jgi:hypothetical protein
MRALLIVAIGLVASTGAALAAGGQSAFQTPSKNIGCIYLGPTGKDKVYFRCDIGGGLHPVPPKPKNCDLDWGYGYEMNSATGRAFTFCAGDTAKVPSAPVLQYGKTWHRGPFTCLSQSIGLKCWNLAKHGFFLSRQHSYTF